MFIDIRVLRLRSTEWKSSRPEMLHTLFVVFNAGHPLVAIQIVSTNREFKQHELGSH